MPSMKKILISVVIPCLNEEASISKCIRAAITGLKKINAAGFDNEIIVVDNGSTDNSVKIARKFKIRLISELRRGYGRAYKTGLAQARGKYIIIGDSDGTYDFTSLTGFIGGLKSGADLVLGSRFLGKLSGKSMPFLNRYLGNPLLTGLINLYYGCRLTDSQTGFRAFTRKAYRKMYMASDGMEFASEMIIKAIDNRLKIREIPVGYAPRIGVSKLSPLLDAWRHVQAILIYSPTYSIILPGLILFLTGIAGSAILLPGPVRFKTVVVDVHSLIVSVLLATIGLNILLTGFFVRLYTTAKLHIAGGFLTGFLTKHITLTRLFITGLILTLIGIGIIGTITFYWILHGFSGLSEERLFIVALGFMVTGIQCLYSSLLFGLLRS